MEFKLGDGKGLREGCDSKELWKSVEESKALYARSAHGAFGTVGDNRRIVHAGTGITMPFANMLSC